MMPSEMFVVNRKLDRKALLQASRLYANKNRRHISLMKEVREQIEDFKQFIPEEVKVMDAMRKDGEVVDFD